MIKINSVSSIVYYVKDLDKSAEFYEALGFRPGNRTESSFNVYVNWFSIEFRLATGAAIDNTGTGAYAGVRVDNAKEFYDFAVSKNIKPATEVTDQPGGVREFVITDPDGYKLIFFDKK